MKYEEFELVGLTVDVPLGMIKIAWEILPFKEHDFDHAVFVFFDIVKKYLEENPEALEALQKASALGADDAAWKNIAEKMIREFGAPGGR